MTSIERGRFYYNNAPRVIISPGFRNISSSPPANLSTHMSPSSRAFLTPNPVLASPIPTMNIINQQSRPSSEEKAMKLRGSKASPAFEKEINEKLEMMDSHRTAKFIEREAPEVTGAKDKETIGSPVQGLDEKANVIQPRYYSPQPEVNEIIILENMLRQTLSELHQSKAQNSYLNNQVASLQLEMQKKAEVSKKEDTVETLNKEKLTKFIDINQSLNKLIQDKTRIIESQREKIISLKNELHQKNQIISKQTETQGTCACNTTHQSLEQANGEASLNRSVIETEEYRKLERLVLERLEENERKLKLIVQEQKVIDMNETIKDEEIHRRKREIKNLRERIKLLEGQGGERRPELSPQPRLMVPNDPLAQLHLTNSMPFYQPNYIYDPRGPAELKFIETQMASMKIGEVEKALEKANKKYRSFKKLTKELKTRIDILLHEVDRQNSVISHLKDPGLKEKNQEANN